MTAAGESTASSPSRPAPSSERARFHPAQLSIAGVLGIGVALWGFLAASDALSDNSLFTHLATGRLILEEGAVPTTDPYSYTARGEPWLVQSWLVSWLYGVADAVVGPAAVRVLAGALGAVTAAGVWSLTRPAKTLLSRLLVAVPALLVAGMFWSGRPLLVGYLGTVLVLLSVQRRWAPAWMVPILWVWTNSHGSFPLAVLLLAAVAVGRRLDGVDVRQDLHRLGWAIAGVALACINPLGPKLLTFPLDLLDKTSILRNVLEWASPDFSTTGARLFLVQLLLAVVALVRKPAWRRVVPSLVFVALALLSLRNVPLASLVLVPAMAPGLAGLGSITGRERGATALGLGAALTVAFAVVVVSVARAPAFDLRTYPEEATAILAAEGLLGGDARVLTSDVVGNYHGLLLGPDAAAFIDDRYDMYPLGLLRNYLVVRGAGPGWADVLDACGVEAVLFERSQPIVQVLTADPAWRVEFSDSEVVLLRRRGAAPDVTPACTAGLGA